MPHRPSFVERASCKGDHYGSHEIGMSEILANDIREPRLGAVPISVSIAAARYPNSQLARSLSSQPSVIL
tara:strand:+ start:3288 stop:3497 length:210 start_codon:yes stop_codon:yes gene_type:complete